MWHNTRYQVSDGKKGLEIFVPSSKVGMHANAEKPSSLQETFVKGSFILS